MSSFIMTMVIINVEIFDVIKCSKLLSTRIVFFWKYGNVPNLFKLQMKQPSLNLKQYHLQSLIRSDKTTNQMLFIFNLVLFNAKIGRSGKCGKLQKCFPFTTQTLLDLPMIFPLSHHDMSVIDPQLKHYNIFSLPPSP